jgi:putative ABC transport system permease protein
MFVRLVYESFRRQKRRKLLAGAAITLGVGVATAMIGVATDIGDKISRELRSYGANLVVTPQEESLDVVIGGINLKPPSNGGYLNEADIPKIKSMFWRNNIVGVAPMLPVSVQLTGSNKVTVLGTYFSKRLTYGKESFTAGVRGTHPWWKVQGAWPADDSQDVLVGEALATTAGYKVGETLELSGEPHRIAGILSAGGNEDRQIVAPISLAQHFLGRNGAVRQIYVSALTKPEDELARRDPKSLSPAMYDRWYCSPYAQSIAFQLQEAIPNSHAEMIRQVAQSEGTVLSRIKGLMLLITLAALVASALAVSSAMATAIFERRAEVGLMKALGAGKMTIAVLFFLEATLLALIAGAVGFAGGAILARKIGYTIFGSNISIQPVLLPLILAIAVIVTFAGSAAAILRAMNFDPVYALRGEA